MNLEDKQGMMRILSSMAAALLDDDKSDYEQQRPWMDGRVGDSVVVLNRMMSATLHEMIEEVVKGLELWSFIDDAQANHGPEATERAAEMCVAMMAIYVGPKELERKFGVTIKPPGGVG